MAGKGKGHGKEKTQPSDDLRHFKMFFLDITPDDKFVSRYRALLREIRDYLQSVIEDEMSNLPKDQRKPFKLGGRGYTPLHGYFLIRLDGPEGPVYLLFRMYDLYLQSFYVDEVWYRLRDANGPLPPKTQLHYGKKPITKKTFLTIDGIIRLCFGSSYLDMPSAVSVFCKAFAKAYNAMRSAAAQVLSNTELVLVPFFKFLVVVLAEGLRFPDCERWVVFGLSKKNGLYPPIWVARLFKQWRKRSCRMYEEKPPLYLSKSIRVVKRMPALHVKLTQPDLYQKSDRLLAEAAAKKLASVLKVADDMKMKKCNDDSVPEHIRCDMYNYMDDEDDAPLHDAAPAAAAAPPDVGHPPPAAPHGVPASPDALALPGAASSNGVPASPDALALPGAASSNGVPPPAAALDVGPPRPAAPDVGPPPPAALDGVPSPPADDLVRTNTDDACAYAPLEVPASTTVDQSCNHTDALFETADDALAQTVPIATSPKNACTDTPLDASATTFEAPKVSNAESKTTTYPHRPGANPCKFYLEKGYCDFAGKCKYDHPDPFAQNPVFNRYGLPKRKGADNCKEFVETGKCKRKGKCKFNHPSPRKKSKRVKEKEEFPLQAQ